MSPWNEYPAERSVRGIIETGMAVATPISGREIS